MTVGALTQSCGLLEGTHVASNLGWRAVDAIAVGDKVLTFDNAMQPVIEVRREVVFAQPAENPQRCWPVAVPSGAFGNRCELILPPDQGVMIECEAAADPMGDPFAVVPAMALDGIRGVHRVPPRHCEQIVTLFFAQDEVIYVEGGTLAYCPRLTCLVSDDFSQVEGPYDVLSLHDAAILVDCMGAEDALTPQTEQEAIVA
jgi:hypothetical protein